MDPTLSNWNKLAITVSPYQLAVWMESKTIDASDINRMAETPAGSEALRLIVRDDLKGQGGFVADSLWHHLATDANCKRSEQ